MGLIVARSKEIRDRFTAGAIGFYTSGQLFLEEYYTLGLIGKAGLGTPHMDGNTRLCTATAAAALKETFGSDGQPGSYTDLDTTEAILHVGHNIASQQTVLWSRILDRRRGPNPPKLVVIDPRRHGDGEGGRRPPRPRGSAPTSPLLNGLLNLIIEAGQVDRAYIEAHTVGFDVARPRRSSRWPPERVEEVTGVPADQLRAAAAILGGAKSLVSTVLQGVYQSMQATAAACQVNNLHLIRGLLGRPGCGALPDERPADRAEHPRVRRRRRPARLPQLGQPRAHRRPGPDLERRPGDHPPLGAADARDADLPLRRDRARSRCSGSAPPTRPSRMPELHRIREILGKPGLFVVVQDAFLTETAALADVVLPAAIWGEKTGCFTNVDRTVHLSLKAIEPPGEARSDLDIFLDYARRMDFRDKDGAPLIKWTDAEGAFEAWKECTPGPPLRLHRA